MKGKLTPYLNFADVSAGEKRRMVAMVRTSGNSGYYVDIFRSDRADNDYLFHHVGTSMEITDSEGNKLPGEALEKFDKTWHEGYHWFSNLHKSDYNQNFIASWSMPEDITARLWMTGGEGREIYQVDAPPTTMNKGLTPSDICMPPMPTPALIIRPPYSPSPRYSHHLPARLLHLSTFGPLFYTLHKQNKG